MAQSKYTINLLRGVQIVGGSQKKNPARNFEIHAKDFTSVEQAVPLRLCYGQDRVAGVQITPIFGFRAKQVTTEAGK
jgi:hypothetical protein